MHPSEQVPAPWETLEHQEQSRVSALALTRQILHNIGYVCASNIAYRNTTIRGNRDTYAAPLNVVGDCSGDYYNCRGTENKNQSRTKVLGRWVILDNRGLGPIIGGNYFRLEFTSQNIGLRNA
jgi:hypothetical protein